MYPRIVASFDPKGFILDSLFAECAITLAEKRRIAGLPAEERGAELLDTLLACQRPNAIAQFLEILSNDDKTSCKWIHDEVHKAALEKVASALPSSLEIGGSSVSMNKCSGDLQFEKTATGKFSFCKNASICESS